MAVVVKPAVVQAPFVVCWPWHMWQSADRDGHPLGKNCVFCSRDIAVPPTYAAHRPVCLYCGLDRGLTPAEDRPFEDDEPVFPLAASPADGPLEAAKGRYMPSPKSIPKGEQG